MGWKSSGIESGTVRRDCDGRRVDHAGCARCEPEGVEQLPGTVEIHPHALVEVGFCLSGDHAREVEHHIGLERDEGLGRAGRERSAAWAAHTAESTGAATRSTRSMASIRSPRRWPRSRSRPVSLRPSMPAPPVMRTRIGVSRGPREACGRPGRSSSAAAHERHAVGRDGHRQPRPTRGMPLAMTVIVSRGPLEACHWP